MIPKNPKCSFMVTVYNLLHRVVEEIYVTHVSAIPLLLPGVLSSGGVPSVVRGEEKLKELSTHFMLQDLSEVRMIHMKAGEAAYRIRTEQSPTANAIFHAAEVPVPRRVNPIHQARTTPGNAVLRPKPAKIVANK